MQRLMYIYDRPDGRHESEGILPPAVPPRIASEKSTQSRHDITANLETSGDRVRLCQITMAASSESSS